MEKTIRRVVIATVLGMLLLTGCGSRTSNTEKAVGESQILFENQLEKDVYGLTIRRGEGWVPPVNGEEIMHGQLVLFCAQRSFRGRYAHRADKRGAHRLYYGDRFRRQHAQC